MFRALRPVGERVPPPTRASPWSLPAIVDLGWFASGTAALACALQQEIRHSGHLRPKVVIPAYTCPDVIAAIAFAGAQPVLVDLEPSRPWFDLNRLADALEDEQVIAVIAINFQGIPERLAVLRKVTDRAGVALVYDHCQGFPVADAAISLSDYVVFSFGRGKPASALAGGAALVNRERRPEVFWPPMSVHAECVSTVKRRIYNWLIHPGLYWLPSALPFLGIGDTRFHKLSAIEGLAEPGIRAAEAAIETYHSRAPSLALQIFRRGINDDIDLARLCETPEDTRLLRYCLLMPDALSKKLALMRLRRAWLGASPLYPAALSHLPGVPVSVSDQTACPAANDFAARLLTLPLHQDVKAFDAERMVRIINESMP